MCVSCGTALGFSRAERAIVPLDEKGQYVDQGGLVWHVCANLGLSGCTWLAAAKGGQCFACDLTRTRPSDKDLVGLTNFPAAERAKRHLVFELDTLGFRVVGKDPAKGGDEENGLAFDLLSSVAENVVIGHDDGVITIDLAESDDAHREKIRARARRAVPDDARPLPARDRPLLRVAARPGPGADGPVHRAVRRRERGLPGGHRPALQGGRAGGLGEVVHLDVRDHAPVRGLRRDLGALPAHLRHRRDAPGSTASPRSRRSARSPASATSSPVSGRRSPSRST